MVKILFPLCTVVSVVENKRVDGLAKIGTQVTMLAKW